MSSLPRFTAAEAAFVLREPVKAVRKALDQGPIQPVLVPRAGGPVREIGWFDLFYLYAVRALRDELTPKARTEFYEALQRSPIGRDGEVRFGRLRIAVSDLVEEMRGRTAALAGLVEAVEFDSRGEPVLKGTDIEVHRIAALLDGGFSVNEVLVDYPSLDAAAVESARAYAEVHPKPGRPYPRTTAKRALGGLGLEALDEMLDRGDAAAE